MSKLIVILSSLLMTNVCFADCSPETILSSMAGNWYGTKTGIYTASLAGTYSGPSAPWKLFTAKVNIVSWNSRAFALTISENISASTNTSQFYAQVNDGKQILTYTLSNCLENDGKVVFSRMTDETIAGSREMNADLLILGLNKGAFLIGFEHGNTYCFDNSGAATLCGSGDYDPYLLSAKP